MKPGQLASAQIGDTTATMAMCRLNQQAFEGVEASVSTYPDAATASAAWTDQQEMDGCEPLSGLEGTATYCQREGFTMGKGESVWSKSVSVLVGSTIRALEWDRLGGDSSALDIKEPMVALYKQTQFPA
ncbi:MAG TPA: hypothetical protein DEG88_10510 [Propionibacteriaceae bacterium]|nr:hypothetical protein [Propionibacteriaceae bacterium]